MQKTSILEFTSPEKIKNDGESRAQSYDRYSGISRVSSRNASSFSRISFQTKISGLTKANSNNQLSEVMIDSLDKKLKFNELKLRMKNLF